MSYELTDTARWQLEQIIDYIAQRSTAAALKTLDDFVEAFHAIADNPILGHFRTDLTDKPFRFYRVHRYLIVYADQANPLCIVRIYGGAEDIRSKLANTVVE